MYQMVEVKNGEVINRNPFVDSLASLKSWLNSTKFYRKEKFKNEEILFEIRDDSGHKVDADYSF